MNTRMEVFANFTTNEIPFLATHPDETNVNDLDFLPKISSPLLKQLVEPLQVIWISLCLLILLPI